VLFVGSMKRVEFVAPTISELEPQLPSLNGASYHWNAG
jgi:hypothetical protein